MLGLIILKRLVNRGVPIEIDSLKCIGIETCRQPRFNVSGLAGISDLITVITASTDRLIADLLALGNTYINSSGYTVYCRVLCFS